MFIVGIKITECNAFTTTKWVASLPTRESICRPADAVSRGQQMTAHELRFTINGNPERAREFLPERKADLSEELPVRSRIVASSDTIVFDGAGRDRIRIDLRSGERLHVDDRAGVYRIHPGPTPRPEGVEMTVEHTERRRRDEAGNILRLSRARYDGWTMEVWTRSIPGATGGIRALWPYLVPGAGEEFASRGVPAEIRLTPDGAGLDEGVHLTLDGIEQVDTVELSPPDEYDRVDDGPMEIKPGGADLGDMIPKGARPPRGGISDGAERIAERRENLQENVEEVRQHLEHGGTSRDDLRTGTGQLSPKSPDAAVVQGPPFLDTIEGLINDVTQTFGTFDSGTSTDDMHVEVDWWDQLSGALEFRQDGTDQTTEFVNSLKRIALYLEVIRDERPPDALTSQQQQTYESEELSEAEVGARLSKFAGTFGDSLQAIADRHWTKLTEPVTLPLGPEDIWKYHVFNFINVHFWDFDVQLKINGNPVLQDLSFSDGEITAKLALDEVRADFEYQTKTSQRGWSVFCNLLTAGVCALLQHNRGRAWLSLTDAEIDVRISRTTRNGAVQFEPRLADADWNTDFGVHTGGVGAKVADALNVGSEAIEDTIYNNVVEGLKEAVEDLPVGDLPEWPNTWNAERGPVLSDPTADVSDGEQILSAEVAQRGGLSAGQPGSVATGPAGEMGYAFSEAYLEAWLREHTGVLNESASLDSELKKELDVEFPDPSTYDDEDDGDEDDQEDDIDTRGCPDPALPEPSYETVWKLERTAPDVELAESDGDRVARVTLKYDVSIEAVKHGHEARKFVERAECVRIDTDHDGGGRPGPRPDPGSPVGRSSGRADRATRAMMDEYSNADILEHVGLQVGATPRLVAARNLRRFRDLQFPSSESTSSPSTLRAAYGGRDDSVAGPVGPGGPRGGPDGDGGRPGGFRPGGGDDVPDRGDDGDDIPGGDFDVEGRQCKPPECHVVIAEDDTTLETFLEAEVEVTTDLKVGFQSTGDPLYPEIRLTATRPFATRVTTSDLHGELFDDEFGISDYHPTLESLAERDAKSVLSSVSPPDDIYPQRHLIPRLLLLIDPEIPRPMIDLVVFKQVGDSNTPDVRATDDHAIWPVEFTETLTDYIN